LSTVVISLTVSRFLDAHDLIDAQGVAELLGLAQRNTVSVYQRRYPAMPRPVVDLGQGRCKLWLRSEIEAWRSERPAGLGR
jgi:glutathione-regulated potassium-efflux system ancillary protein KefG